MDRETVQKCLTLAQGCHDYNGGYHGTEGEIFHHGVQTVINVLESFAQKELNDTQLSAVFAVGSEMKRKTILALKNLIEMHKKIDAGFAPSHEEQVAIEEYAENVLEDLRK